MKQIFAVLILALLFTGFKCEKEFQQVQISPQQQIIHLKAFAKAYGYVKYFHPSDEASAIDWKRFSAFGAKEIVNCKNTDEAIAKLNELFKPIAPGIVFSGEQQPYDLSLITPGNTKKYKSTYWQHNGVSRDMNYQSGIYRSVRPNRYTEIDEASGFGNLVLSLDSEKYKGKEIKYTAWVKLKERSEGTGHLWLRVDKSDNTPGFFENMDANPIESNNWEQYEIVGEVDELASGIVLGSFLKGKGTLLIDDVHLYYKENEEWIEIPIKNNDFEAETIGKKNKDSDWAGNSQGYYYTISSTDSKEGKQAAIIGYEGKVKRIKGRAFFDSHPEFGELIEKEIGEGIYCQIPLNLYTSTEHTFPESSSLQILQKQLDVLDLSSNSTSLFIGNVINTYNVFQHFYPYFDEVEVDWDNELTTALERSLQDQTEEEHLVSLQKFTAPLKDGHISVRGPNDDKYIPGINWEWIEGQLVITQVEDQTADIKLGDIVTRINNQSPKDYFEEINSRISAGTEGWLKYRAQRLSRLGEQNEELILEIDSREIVLTRDRQFDYNDRGIAVQENDYKVLDGNIYYLNLDKIEMDTINALMPKLEQAKGIICDLRGYPNGNHGFISHLLKEKDTSKAWMRVPKIIYPDQEKIIGYENHGWELKPNKPYLGDKKVVFITDGRAISYAESFMSFIEGYELATIVGQPTAGTNGNINPFGLLGDYIINWTGMKVVKHDGSQLHAIGITPDIYVSKTIEGITAGKDEFLEKAVEVILK
ncbi:S41 family peptidase [Salegentibacter sp. HM20]